MYTFIVKLTLSWCHMFELKILALCVSKVGSVLSKMEQMDWFRHGVLCTGWATSPVFIQTGFFINAALSLALFLAL